MKRILIALLLCAAPFAAQSSALEGSVTDAQGAAIPDAIVTARNFSTAAERKTLTNATGEYSLLQLPPGTYTITIEKPGFHTHKGEVVLQVNTPATIN